LGFSPEHNVDLSAGVIVQRISTTERIDDCLPQAKFFLFYREMKKAVIVLLGIISPAYICKQKELLTGPGLPRSKPGATRLA